jgi:hypothetical protein
MYWLAMVVVGGVEWPALLPKIDLVLEAKIWKSVLGGYGRRLWDSRTVLRCSGMCARMLQVKRVRRFIFHGDGARWPDIANDSVLLGTVLFVE